MPDYQIITARVEGFLEEYDGELFHAVFSDPPYGLNFMGKHWDHGVPGKLIWEGVADLLLPGAPLLAFGGTRTFHRLMVAIEDAGFDLRDTISWNYGQGFPKSMNVSKAIDATLLRGGSDTRRLKQTNENDREQIGQRIDPDRNNGFKRESQGNKVVPITAPSHPRISNVRGIWHSAETRLGAGGAGHESS